MKYKSQLELAVKMKEIKIKEVEEKLAKLLQERRVATNIYEKEQKKIDELYLQIKENKIKNSHELFGIPSSEKVKKLKESVSEIDKKINIEKKNYQQLNESKKYIIELDKQREKAFYFEVEKKEQRKIEDIKNVKIKKERG